MLIRHLATRVLLQDPAETHSPDDEEQPSEDTLDLRIAAIFVILASGLSGSLLALVIPCFRNPVHPATLILRAVSAGVILSLAIIHVVPDGMNDLAKVHEYPFGPLATVFGVLLMVWTESLSRSLLHRSGSKSTSVDNLHSSCASDHEPGKEPPLARLEITVAQASKPTAAAADGKSETHAQGHACLALHDSSEDLAAGSRAAIIRHQVIAYMFELACVVHSFLIGLALGVGTDNRQEAIALFAALVFHQGLEGIGLGSAIVRANFSLWKGLFMTCTYAIMTPLGVAIGIGIAGSYEGESTTALAVQGTLNSVSGGLLLYISLVQLIAEDFTRADLRQAGVWGQVGMHVALMVGAGCMAMIGIWN